MAIVKVLAKARKDWVGSFNGECCARGAGTGTTDDSCEFAAYLRDEETLIFDGVEQTIQHPQDNALQKEFYSGKKSVTPSRP